MIFSGIDEIAKIIKTRPNHKLIERAESIKEKHELHVSGIGLEKYLSKIQGLENENALSIRKALAKEITSSNYEMYLKPMDKIFSARGGNWSYNFSNENDVITFETKVLNNIDGQYSIDQWMQNVWKNKVNIDPSGLAFIEIDNIEPDKIYLTYKSINDIYEYDFKSISNISYVIFNPETRKIKDGQTDYDAKFYRVVDDAYDYTIKEFNGVFSIVENETYINYFGKVPAVIFSTCEDKKSYCKTTWVAGSMPLADIYLLDHTVHTIYKLKQGIPYVYEYERDCPVCGGTGRTNDGGICSNCKGSGVAKNRDVAEVIVLPIPAAGQPTLIPPAGYVQPDLNTWKQQEDTLGKTDERIYESIWGGGAYLSSDRDKTAFEVAIRKAPEDDKLNTISSNAEQFEKAITDLFAQFYFPNSYNGCIISYGRRYSIKSADVVFDAYTKSVSAGLSSVILDALLSEYFYSIYENNEQQLKEAIIKLKTKPFYHFKPIDVKGLGANIVDYYKHLYYDEFIVDFEKTKKLYMSDIDEVQKELDVWIKSKISTTLTPRNKIM